MQVHIAIQWLILAALAIFALGYAFRGWIHREIAISDEKALRFALRLEAAAYNVGGDLKKEVVTVAGDIRKAIDEAALKL